MERVVACIKIHSNAVKLASWAVSILLALPLAAKAQASTLAGGSAPPPGTVVAKPMHPIGDNRTCWQEANMIGCFTNMDKVFPMREVRNAAPAIELKENRRAVSYRFGNADYKAADFLDHHRSLGLCPHRHAPKYDAHNAASLKQLVAGGTKLFRFPKDFMDKAFKESMDLYSELSASNPAWKKVYTDYAAFRKDANL